MRYFGTLASLSRDPEVTGLLLGSRICLDTYSGDNAGQVLYFWKKAITAWLGLHKERGRKI